MEGRAPVAFPRPTVLVVDDDPAVRSSLRFSLEVEGFTVRAYRTGAELLQDSDLPTHACLVIDYKLPDQTGLDLLTKLRDRQVILPAILVTTAPSLSVRQRAASAGVSIIEKPLLGEALFQGIRAALDGATTSARRNGHGNPD